MLVVKGAGNITNKYENDYADIRRELLKFRFDQKYQGRGNRVPIARFAELCSLSRQTLHNLTNENLAVGLLPETAKRIKAALEIVLNQGVRWRRIDQTWCGFFPDGKPLPAQPQLPGVCKGRGKKHETEHDYPHL